MPEQRAGVDAIRVGSLFSGIGGFDCAMERVGMAVEWQCEIDPDARGVLARHWPDVPLYDDVTTLEGNDVAAVDVLCGGFPCQDLSLAGRRAGLAGERSGLFHEFMRIADALAPDWVLIENVPGLLSSNDGRDMGVVLGVLADLGYGFAWRVLDSRHFGVAQRRRRVFVVGSARGTACAARVLLEPESSERDSRPPQAGLADPPATIESVAMRGRDDGSRPELGGDLAFTLRASQGGGDKAYVACFTENQRGEVWETPYSSSINIAGGKPGQGYPAVREGSTVRRLTPLECERLQGFPDGWTAGQSDAARYKQLGNAVCVPVVEWIGARLLNAHHQAEMSVA